MEEKNKDEVSYKRENGENIVDPNAIKSCKDEQNRDIIENGRLGSYDKYGNYILIPEIRDELINIPKLIYNTREEDRDKIYDLKSKLPIFGEFFFKLKISKVEAVLYLVETVTREAGEYVEVYEEVVDTISLAEEKIPEKIIFRTFNIFETEDDYGKEFEEFFGFENILLRKMYLSFLSSKLQEKTKEEEKEYFKQMFEILENGGEYGKRVINEFMRRLKDRKEIFDTQDEEEYNRATSEILLSAIEMVTTEKDLQDENTKKIYIEVINVRNKNIEKHIREAQKEVDEKYVKEAVNNATRAHIEKNEEKQNEVKLQFEDRISKKVTKSKTKEKKTLEKPLMKQLTAKKQKDKILDEVIKKEILKDETKTKEEKVKALVEKKEQAKKQDKPIKKVTPAKAQKKASASKSASKGGAKKSGGGAKKPSKPQVKKRAAVKASSSQKAQKSKPWMTKAKPSKSAGGASKKSGGGKPKPAVKKNEGRPYAELNKIKKNDSISPAKEHAEINKVLRQQSQQKINQASQISSVKASSVIREVKLQAKTQQAKDVSNNPDFKINLNTADYRYSREDSEQTFTRISKERPLTEDVILQHYSKKDDNEQTRDDGRSM